MSGITTGANGILYPTNPWCNLCDMIWNLMNWMRAIICSLL
jgi:hypothetical protein